MKLRPGQVTKTFASVILSCAGARPSPAPLDEGVIAERAALAACNPRARCAVRLPALLLMRSARPPCATLLSFPPCSGEWILPESQRHASESQGLRRDDSHPASEPGTAPPNQLCLCPSPPTRSPRHSVCVEHLCNARGRSGPLGAACKRQDMGPHRAWRHCLGPNSP